MTKSNPWLCIDGLTYRIVTRRNSHNEPTGKDQYLGVWFRVVQEVWSKYRAGDICLVDDVPAQTLDYIARCYRIQRAKQ